MLSHEDNSGVGAFVIGMIVLVMSAVGLSLLVDRRFNFSNSQSELEREVAAGEHRIDALRAELELRSGMLAANSDLRGVAERAATLRTEVAAAAGRLEALNARHESLRKEVGDIENRFAQTRADYRRKAWKAAEGERLEVLETRSGRRYREVVIKRVTPVGIEIDHASGIARLEAPQLPSDWHERFQWDDEERREKLRQEQLHRERMAQTAPATDTTPVVAVTKAEARRAERQQELERINAAREEVQQWRRRLSALREEHRTAEYNARYGKQVSVPGKLETWSARAARLRGDVQRAQRGLAEARAKLSLASPGDALVRPDPNE